MIYTMLNNNFMVACLNRLPCLSRYEDVGSLHEHYNPKGKNQIAHATRGWTYHLDQNSESVLGQCVIVQREDSSWHQVHKSL